MERRNSLNYLYLITIVSFLIGLLTCKKETCNYKIYCISNIFTIVSIFLNNPFFTIITPIVISQSIIDFKKLELSDVNNITIAILGIFYSILNGFDYKAFIFISLFFIIVYILPFSSLGFGDVKYAIAISFFIKYNMVNSFIFYSLFIVLFIGIFYRIVKKQKECPMGPAIGITALLLLLI